MPEQLIIKHIVKLLSISKTKIILVKGECIKMIHYFFKLHDVYLYKPKLLISENLRIFSKTDLNFNSIRQEQEAISKEFVPSTQQIYKIDGYEPKNDLVQGKLDLTKTYRERNSEELKVRIRYNEISFLHDKYSSRPSTIITTSPAVINKKIINNENKLDFYNNINQISILTYLESYENLLDDNITIDLFITG